MRIKLSLLVLCLLIAPALFASSVPSMPAPSTPGMTQNTAAQSFNDGLRYRDRAWKAEKELATATDPASEI